MLALQCDTSCRWGEVAARDVEKNSASPGRRPGLDVVAENNDDIVEAVLPPKIFRACGIGH